MVKENLICCDDCSEYGENCQGYDENITCMLETDIMEDLGDDYPDSSDRVCNCEDYPCCGH